MPTSDELRAQLAVAELEEELAAMKDADTDSAEYRDLKLRVRDARQAYRETYRRPSDAVVDGTAEPATVKASAVVKEDK